MVEKKYIYNIMILKGITQLVYVLNITIIISVNTTTFIYKSFLEIVPAYSQYFGKN